MAVGQALPVRFPCWCKAVYSWGGEVSRDRSRCLLLHCTLPVLTATPDEARPRIHRRRPDRGPQRRRWSVVDGAVEARPAHGRTVPLQLRRTAQRGLPAMGPEWQRRRHVAAEQRARTGQACVAEVEEHVPEALHSLCSCRRPEPSCSGA
jgi:hypothetical protein